MKVERYLLMKLFAKTLALTAAVVTLGTAAQTAQAQGGRGGGTPEEMRQRMMERYKEQFAVKDEAEWKVIEPKIAKVIEARTATTQGRGGFGFGGGNRQRGGGDNAAGGGERPNRGGGGFGTPSPEVEALQKAIEAKAPADEIKTKLAKVREARKAAEAKLDAAQEDLKKVLSVNQEAVAVMAGLLK